MLARLVLIALFLALGSHTAFAADAYCPVTGMKIPITPQTNYVEFTYGQRIYTCCPDCAKELAANITKFLRSARDDPVWEFVPDMTNQTFQDFVCQAHGKIDIRTPRVQFKYGQSIYFTCFPCTLTFFRSPEKFIQRISDFDLVASAGPVTDVDVAPLVR